MAFFDELSKRAGSIATTAQKTANVAKIQHQINQKESEFDALYHQIGQIYYSCRQRGVPVDESIAALCDRVTTLAQEIEALRGEADRIRNVRRCTGCGKVIDRSVKFCPNCGAKIEQEAAEATEAPKPAEEPVESSSEEAKVTINWPRTGEETASAPKAEEETPAAEETENEKGE